MEDGLEHGRDVTTMLREPRVARSIGVGVAVALLAGLAHAFVLRWTCDDAFISFRYARNLLRGQGLVFNPGEAVEGYTNFLWTLGVSLGMGLGIDPIDWSHAWGLLSWLAVGVGLAGLAWRSGRLPVAAVAWAAFPYGRVFATSGLETMGFTALATGAVLLGVSARSRQGALVAGVLASMALLTRPEGALVVAAVGAVVTWRSRHLLVAVALPVAVLVLPWLAFKLYFYGELLPNTYYAKAGAGPRWGDGLAYLGLFFGVNGVLGLGLLGWLMPDRRDRVGQVVVVGFLAVYFVHIARAGGDFMYARFLVPLVPLLCVGLERLVDRAMQHDGRMAVLGVAVALGVFAAPPPDGIFQDVDPDDVGAGGVVDERSWYPPEAIALAREQGAALRECVSKTSVRSVYYGTQAMLMFYADLPYALEPHVGLTDYDVARMPPPEGVRVGHGQKADTAYLRSRNIDLALGYRLQLPTTKVTRIAFPGDISGRLLTYRRPVVAELRACGARVLDFERFLDQWIVELDTLDDDKVAKAYASFSDYYFDHNHDPEREGAFRARLGLPPKDD